MDPITFQPRTYSLNSSFTYDTPLRPRDAALLHKRSRLVAREQTRWARVDEELNRQHCKLLQLSQKLQRIRKRNVSEAYNPVTGDYYSHGSGDMLREADESAYLRAERRNAFLASKQRRPFNIINGMEAPHPVLPRFHLLPVL